MMLEKQQQSKHSRDLKSMVLHLLGAHREPAKLSFLCVRRGDFDHGLVPFLRAVVHLNERVFRQGLAPSSVLVPRVALIVFKLNNFWRPSLLRLSITLLR